MLHAPLLFGVFAVVFLVPHHLAKLKPGQADRDLQNTPLSFGTMLIATLFVVFTEGRSPASDSFEQWLGYVCDLVLIGYLVRSYARLYARVQSSDSRGLDRTV